MFKTIFDTNFCKLIQNTKTKISLGFPIRPLPDKSAIEIQIQIQILLGFPNFPSSPCLTNLPIELLRQCWGRRGKSPSYNFCGEGTRMYKNLSNKKLSSFYRICEIFTISLCKFSFGESPQRETLLGRFNKIDPESALRKPFVLTAILYSVFYLKYLRGSNVPQEIFCPDSCQNPLKFPP